MKRWYITIFQSLFSIVVVLLVILSFDEVKIIPSTSVILMAIGVNYSLFRYNKFLSNEKGRQKDNELKDI